MSRWAFVDDQPAPAAAFADELSEPESGFEVFLVGPGEARRDLLSASTKVDGVLIDVDLSDVPGEHGTGPGIAQDIRINQENGKLPPFALVRFASRAKVIANIGGDVSSDDLFDLKIDKESAARDVAGVRRSLIGCTTIYQGVAACHSFEMSDLARFFGVQESEIEGWAHSEFLAKLQSAGADKPHVAGVLIMKLISQPGPLIDEFLLSVRLGVDRRSDGWASLREALSSVRYEGTGHEYFDRWWARGVEDWWLDTEGAETPLSSMTVEQRLAQLAKKYPNLDPIEIPDESPGKRPWRVCKLSLEEEEPQFIPVDPAYGVRTVSRNDAPWFDPTYSALGVALQHKHDPRLNRADLERHASMWQ